MRLGVVLLVLLVATACGSEGSDAGAPAASPSATAAPTPTEAPWQTLDGPLGRCGPQPPELGDVAFRYRVLTDPAVGRIPAVTVGSGRTVAVLLHQTDGNGLCGWLEFAARIARDRRLTALAIDLCQYGARCRPDRAQTDPVAVAVRHARQALHADRVVVVGASMGGAVALMSAASLDGVDAAVDLSGPSDWPGVEAVRGGRALQVPVLVAMARDEGPEEVRAARGVVALAPAGSRFEPAATGHGYDLLQRLGDDVLSWIRG